MCGINVDSWLGTAEAIAFGLGAFAFACLMFQTVAAGTRQGLKQGLILLAILATFLWGWIGGIWAAIMVAAIAGGWVAVALATCEGALRETLGGRWYGAKLLALAWFVVVAGVFIILTAADHGL